jgi:hypothetical protein
MRSRTSPVLLMQEHGGAEGQADQRRQPGRKNRVDDPISPEIADDFA